MGVVTFSTLDHFQIMEKRANNIQFLRERKNLTQEELADLVGHSVGTIQKLEKGGMKLTSAYLAKLRGPLGASSDEIIGLEPIVDSDRYTANSDKLFNVQKISNISELRKPKEMIVDTPFMEPILKNGSTILYDGSVNAINEPGVYVFQDGHVMFALHAEPLLFSDKPQVRIWGEQGFKEVIIDSDRVLTGTPRLVGRVRLYAQPF